MKPENVTIHFDGSGWQCPGGKECECLSDLACGESFTLKIRHVCFEWMSLAELASLRDEVNAEIYDREKKGLMR